MFYLIENKPESISWTSGNHQTFEYLMIPIFFILKKFLSKIILNPFDLISANLLFKAVKISILEKKIFFISTKGKLYVF